MMKTCIKLFSFLACMLAADVGLAEGAPVMDPALREKAGRAVDAGLHYLRLQQTEQGDYSNSVGITALALRGFLESHRGYNEGDGAFITRPVNFILNHVNDDGSISETNQNRSYNTAVAVVALAATNNPAYDEIIRNAQNFLKGLQVDTDEGYSSDHKYYGGIGYGSDERPDMSNAYLALEALAKSKVARDDPVWEKALYFMTRSQNNSETNNQEWAGTDGGFIYAPGFSPHGVLDSYGGMTHAGLITLLFAGVDKMDPRVQAAYDWIRDNYTLEENPGAPDKQGLFFYYNVFAKSMLAFGEPTVTDTSGVSHNWRNDIAAKLISLQLEDGSWVNQDSPRWWEGNPHLCTARAVIALDQALRTDSL
ncbi:MAG: terpene cyclase/mutase family protein [Proteobacteria bacterium]|nr:terpene cyclase/mutase family protein [Pseudomonadota bacterium]